MKPRVAPELPSESSGHVGLPRRLGCILYDTLIVLALVWAASLPTGHADLTQPGMARTLYQGSMLVVCIAYFIGFWKLRMSTVGMRAWGIRVVCPDGTRISWTQALLRALLALVSWAPLGLGFWWSLLRGDRLCWHDLGSGTRLVRSP